MGGCGAEPDRSDGRQVTFSRGEGNGAVPPVKEHVDAIVDSPVFVDASGRRRGWVSRARLVFSATCCGYVTVLAVGLLGAPVRPGDLLPWVAPPSASAAK